MATRQLGLEIIVSESETQTQTLTQSLRISDAFSRASLIHPADCRLEGVS